MHLHVFFYLKKNVHFLHDKQQWKCPQEMENPQRKQRSAVCWELSDVSFFPLFCWHHIFCLLPGAAEPQILDFVHSGPDSQGQEENVVQLSFCHCQLSAEGKLKCKCPHS